MHRITRPTDLQSRAAIKTQKIPWLSLLFRQKLIFFSMADRCLHQKTKVIVENTVTELEKNATHFNN